MTLSAAETKADIAQIAKSIKNVRFKDEPLTIPPVPWGAESDPSSTSDTQKTRNSSTSQPDKVDDSIIKIEHVIMDKEEPQVHEYKQDTSIPQDNDIIHDKGNSKSQCIYITKSQSTVPTIGSNKEARQISDHAKNSEGNSQATELDITNTINSVTNNLLPHINATIDGISVECLIDTGSSANIMHTDLFDKLKLKLIQPSGIKLVGVNSSPVTVRGQTEVTLFIGNTPHKVELIVANNINSLIILGNPFVQSSSAILDLKEHKITIPGQRNTVIPMTTANPVEANHNLDIHVSQATSVTDHELQPFHAKWIKISEQSRPVNKNATYTILFEPEANVGCFANVQRVHYDPTEHPELYVLAVNQQNSVVCIKEGQKLGTLEYNDSKNCAHIPVDVICPETNTVNNVTVNRAYELPLTEEQRELRWQHLCTVLKLNEWEINEEQKHVALEKLREYEFCFALPNEPLGILKGYEHHIELKEGATPVAQRPRPLPEEKQKILDAMLQDLLDRGIIRHSRSEWAAPVCLVEKPQPSTTQSGEKPKKEYRLTVDWEGG